MRIKKSNIPETSIVIRYPYDYSDSYKASLTNNEAIDMLGICKVFFMSSPQWVDTLFGIRNKIVSVFGLKTGIEDTAKSRKEVLENFKGEIGEQLGIFKVFEKSDTEIIMGEDDRYLNFRVSLIRDLKSDHQNDLIVSTTVKFNNSFGRGYFYIVKPFHKIIVRMMLKNTINQLNLRNY